MILINLVKVNHLIYCVQEKTRKIKKDQLNTQDRTFYSLITGTN